MPYSIEQFSDNKLVDDLHIQRPVNSAYVASIVIQ
jgi:hypothetical protein